MKYWRCEENITHADPPILFLKSFIHAYTHAVATHIAVTMAALKPPFTIATAHQKVKFAQAMWNTCNPAQVSKGYTSDCIWRNRDRFIKGTDEIIGFLTQKWEKEREYRLRKELFAVGGEKEGDMNKIAVQFWYEYRDKYDGMKWKRCYGLEDWTFNVSDPHVRTLQE